MVGTLVRTIPKVKKHVSIYTLLTCNLFSLAAFVPLIYLINSPQSVTIFVTDRIAA